MKKLRPYLLPILLCLPGLNFAQGMIDTVGARALLDSAEAQIKTKAYDEAILNCMDAIQMYESMDMKSADEMALAYEHMGRALKLKKNYDLAIKAFQQCVDIREASPEPKDKLLAQCYYGIAHSHNDKQEYDLSLEPYHKVLQLREEIYGPYHEALVSLHRVVGNVYFKNGNGDQAIEHYQKGLEIQQHLDADPQVFETQLLSNIAEVMGARGDLDQAILYGQKAINAARQYERNARSITYQGIAYLNLAGYLEQKGEHELALKHLETAVELLDEGQGPGNPTTAIVHGDMANVYYNMGEWEKAEEYYLKWLNNWKETMPPGYFYFAEIYMRFGDFYVKTGQPDKGLELLEMAKEKLEATFEGNHPELSRVYILLGNAYLAKSDFVQARVHYQYALLASQDQESLIAQCTDPGFLVKSYMGLGSIYSERYAKDQRLTHIPLALENYD
ncbi:MAG: tetratricopeptide repeat protein, partial [Phaeodactylibacter sp.]|nr:tetratricopeptide repeat protein [Phaeodactylibacter sp.]